MKYPNGTISNSKFGIQISFERNSQGINGILINYHFMCTILVLIASINFVIDPTIVPGRAGFLVTLFLVLTNFFSAAQVLKYHLPNLIISRLLPKRRLYILLSSSSSSSSFLVLFTIYLFSYLVQRS